MLKCNVMAIRQVSFTGSGNWYQAFPFNSHLHQSGWQNASLICYILKSLIGLSFVQLRCLERAISCLYSITGVERDGSVIVNMLVHQDQLQRNSPGLLSVTIAHKLTGKEKNGFKPSTAGRLHLEVYPLHSSNPSSYYRLIPAPSSFLQIKNV